MEEMWGYVAANAGADTLKLMLKSEPDLPFDKRFAVMQIECRKKTRNKIPELLANERFLFPKAISAEQCTHQQVAQFHASLFLPTDSVLDMTMGLGVDSYYISSSGLAQCYRTRRGNSGGWYAQLCLHGGECRFGGVAHADR